MRRGVGALALAWAMGAPFASLVAVAPPAGAHTDSARGDVVRMIRMTGRTVTLPDVPGWHYHRVTGDGRKTVTIQPYDAKTGAHKAPKYEVIAAERGVRTADEWSDAIRASMANHWGTGWMAIDGVRCPWTEASSSRRQEGPAAKIVYMASRGVGVELWYRASGKRFKEGLPAFDRFAAGVRIR